MSAIPADWKEEMDFFKELEVTNTNKLSGLRAGKASEQAEFESLLKEVRYAACPPHSDSVPYLGPYLGPISTRPVHRNLTALIPPQRTTCVSHWCLLHCPLCCAVLYCVYP
jgi:hypothetical protein